MIELESALSGDEDQETQRKPGFIYAVIGQGLFSASRLATSVIIGGRFAQEGATGMGSEVELGIYLAYFSILLFCISVLEAFVTIPMTYLMHTRHGMERKQFSSFLLLVCGAMGVVACFLILIAGCLLQSWYPIITPGTLLAFGLLVLTQYLREFLMRWILARLESKKYALIEALYAVLYLPMLVGLLLTDNLSVMNLLGCLTLANLVIASLWWWHYKNEFANLFSTSPHPDKVSIGAGHWSDEKPVLGTLMPILNEQIFYGRWISADSICYLATVYFCNWYLLLKVGAAGAGVYGACMTVVLLANPFLNGVMSVFAPVSAVAYESGGKPALTRTMLKFGVPLTVMMVFFSLFLYFGGQWLTEKFFGDRYSDFFETNYNGVNRITFLIGLSLPFTTIAYILASGVMAYGKPMYAFLSSAVGLGAMLILCLLLKDPSLEQCAICFTVSIVSMVVSRLFFYLRKCPPNCPKTR